MANLVILTGPKAGETVELAKDEFVIGREAACDLAIEDGTVSRRHAAIRREGGRFSVRDLGSRNGIRVQGKKTDGAEIRHGDIVHVGSVQIRFVSDAPAAAEPPTVKAAPAAGAPRRRLDMPAIVLGVGILAALWLLFGTLRDAKHPAIEVVVLAVDEERYYSLDGPIRALGALTPPGIVSVEGEPGQSALVLDGLEEGRAELPVTLEEGSVLLKFQVTERPMRRRRTDVTPEEAMPAAERAISEGTSALDRDTLLLVAVQKFREAADLFERAGAGEAEWARAKSCLGESRRKLRAARQAHESAFFLAAKQHNAHRAQEEALVVLNLIDPAEDSLGYQKWADRLDKLGISAAQIPMRLEKLRRTAR